MFTLLIGQDGTTYFVKTESNNNNPFDPEQQGSMVVPYYESFDNFDFHNTNDLWKIEFFHNRHGLNYWYEKINE